MTAKFGPLDSSEDCAELSGVVAKLMTHLQLGFEVAVGLLVVGFEVVVAVVVVEMVFVDFVVVVVEVSLVEAVLSCCNTFVVVVREEFGGQPSEICW